MDKKSILKNLKKNLKGNEGMALVTVIVAIGFVAALVSILLTTTLVNFKMKVVNERGDGLGVEDGARSARVDKETGFLTMDRSFDHDMEAVSFDVKQLHRNFDIASHIRSSA